MLRCIIIEDQAPAQKIIQNYIAKTDSLLLKATFLDAIEANKYLAENSIDLIFLDINLPQISGMNFLRSLENQPAIILTTAYSEYALESYEHNVIDYLLKPFSYDRFCQAIEKVITLGKAPFSPAKNTTGNTVYIKSGHDIVKVEDKDIRYIKSDADYTEIITHSQKHLASDPLKYWLKQLGDNFCQVHKSYIINIDHLDKVSQNKIHLTNEYVIPIGRAYKKVFMEKLMIK